MNIPYLVVTAITIIMNAGATAADITHAGFVMKTSAEVGVPRSWLPGLALLKGAGAAALVLGVVGFRTIGLAGAAGLVLFFVGAVIAHIRARVLYNIVFPSAYLAFALASLVLSTAQ